MRFFALVYGKILGDTMSRDPRKDIAVFSARVQMSLLLTLNLLAVWLFFEASFDLFEVGRDEASVLVCIVIVYFVVRSMTKEFDLARFSEENNDQSALRSLALLYPYAVFFVFGLAVAYVAVVGSGST